MRWIALNYAIQTAQTTPIANSRGLRSGGPMEYGVVRWLAMDDGWAESLRPMASRMVVGDTGALEAHARSGEGPSEAAKGV